MPEGVVVVVEPDGFATVDFVDPEAKGPGLAALLEVGGPEMIEKNSRPRGGSRPVYRVPEGNARAAGLLDDEPAEAVIGEADVDDDPEVHGDDPQLQQVEGGGTVVEVQPGETAELVAEDNGGPYTDLPEVENPDGTVELEPASEPTQGYDDGQPDMDWSRKAIDDHAAGLTPPLDTTGEANKKDALAAIKAAKAKAAEES